MRHHNLGFDERLLDAFDLSQWGKLRRTVSKNFLAGIALDDAIPHVRNGDNNVLVVLPAKALCDDLEVQQSGEPAPESKTQSPRRFRFKRERSIIQL